MSILSQIQDAISSLIGLKRQNNKSINNNSGSFFGLIKNLFLGSKKNNKATDSKNAKLVDKSKLGGSNNEDPSQANSSLLQQKQQTYNLRKSTAYPDRRNNMEAKDDIVKGLEQKNILKQFPPSSRKILKTVQQQREARAKAAAETIRHKYDHQPLLTKDTQIQEAGISTAKAKQLAQESKTSQLS
ncbi:MAG: hypothetical protein SFT93_05335 [Rickettsiaceae bacterium]|nr:hypothetical protein [Rickettsiaceae bacterium]